MEKSQERINCPRAIKKKGKYKGRVCVVNWGAISAHTWGEHCQDEEGSLSAFQKDSLFHFFSRLLWDADSILAPFIHALDGLVCSGEVIFPVFFYVCIFLWHSALEYAITSLCTVHFYLQWACFYQVINLKFIPLLPKSQACIWCRSISFWLISGLSLTPCCILLDCIMYAIANGIISNLKSN